MIFDYKNVPQELKEEKRWVLWRKKEQNGRNTKVPISAYTGNGAKSNDDSTWSTYDEAVANAELFRATGLGFELGNGYFGVDIDHALDDTLLIQEFVTSLNSYTEISQSGEGIHIICKGTLPEGRRRKDNIEMYDSTRFFALTGNLYEEKYKEVKDCTYSVKILFEKYLRDEQANYSVGASNPTNNKYLSILTDDEVIEKAQKSKLGDLFTKLYMGDYEADYTSQSEADYSFCKLLAFWCNRDEVQMDRIVRNSGLMRDKWDRPVGNSTYGSNTINRANISCTKVYTKPTNTKQPIYNVETGEVHTKDYRLDDTGNAERFIDTYGDNLRFDCDNKVWFIWNGVVWENDKKQKVKKLANKLLKEMQDEAFDMCSMDKEQGKAMLSNAKRLASHTGKEAMLAEATAIGKTPVQPSEFDTHKYLLNCKNGIVDLHTGELHEHDKRFMQTNCTNIEYKKGEPTRWVKFLHEIFAEGSTEERVNFMQVAMGYTLTGDTREQCLFQCYGKGSNGKGVFFDIMIKILGDYGMTGNIESILKTKGISNSSNASPDIAQMIGKRLIVMNEAEEGARYNEPLLKTLTGGTDEISARQLYGRMFTFKPNFKLWLATNYKVKVRGTDYGIWRRQRLMGFNQTFTEKNNDKKLPEKLEKELSSILYWAVQGCLKWQEEELDKPKFMQEDLLAYQKENDTLQFFLDEHVNEKANSNVQAQKLYNAYKQWAKNGNEYCMSQTKFGSQITDRGFTKRRICGKVQYENIELNVDSTYNENYSIGE